MWIMWKWMMEIIMGNSLKSYCLKEVWVFSVKKTVDLCQSMEDKKIHMSYTEKMCINMWIMWITISREAVLLFLQRLRLP